MTMTKRAKNPRTKTLRPVRPNAGIEKNYRQRLDALINEMHRSTVWFLMAAYNKNEPEVAVLAQRIAQDDRLSANVLRSVIRKLTKRWTKRFDQMAKELAKYFAESAEKRSSMALRKILKDGGFTVKFQITPAIRDIMAATVHENVELIKSIAPQYLTQVEGIVMRGVSAGRDAEVISFELQKRLGVTRRRAALIARDQNNKATAAFLRARHLEIGITKAIWVHSGGGHQKRPSHVKASQDKVEYDIAKGWYDPDEKKWIQPGELINCKCISRPVVPGFE
jgi:uncharacterized protein with gpF-like domain